MISVAANRRLIAFTCVFVTVGAVLAAWQLFRGREPQRHVDFNHDIRPILNQNCMSCHGGVKQQGNVSFIYREQALGKGRSGRPTVVPGKPNASELIARVTSNDPETRMPYHAPPLQPQQIALLQEWIKEGAPWAEHWAFVPPKPQRLPAIKDAAWPKQALDRFILARLESEGLSPSAEAGKLDLLRRVSFDLIGLPSTPEEQAAFLADKSPDAYEKQVQRLLASPHYGERWASLWLDLARYADSRGYEKDRERPSWPYRDWVINAFNENLPYDRFVITQLAGDLLPNSTFEDRIATAFQRQTPTNDEGGTDDEEFRLAAVMDRVATTWSVLNGLTVNCVQCHSHPYDPIRHAEYYKFLAFYNSSTDADLYDDSPVLAVPKESSSRAEIAQLQRQQELLSQEIVGQGRSLVDRTEWTALPIIKGVANEVDALEWSLEQLTRAQRKDKNPKLFAEAIAQVSSVLDQAKQTSRPILLTIEHGEARASEVTPPQSTFELSTVAGPSVVTALRIEVAPLDPGKAGHSPEDEFFVDDIQALVHVLRGGEERHIRFRYFAPDSPDNLRGVLGSRDALRPDDETGALNRGTFGSNGKLFQTRWIIAVPEEPLRAGGPDSRLQVRLVHRAVKRVRLSTSHDEHWTSFANDRALAAKLGELVGAQQRLAQIPSVLLPVMAEQPAYQRRQTLEFERGNFLTKIGPLLSPDVPVLFPKLPTNAPRNRLTMAKWFFEPGQPLTARVAVNRYWEQLFGLGLVETLEDFGSSGEKPSHPQLLDWLALHFQDDLHWDMKALLREIVTSATYRQSHSVKAGLLAKDPRNRLLARGPQQRLTAEMVRDQALLAGGLLTPAMGGPPVMPPQPAGVWMTSWNDREWRDATGPDRYRRAIYTYLKRSSIYPSFLLFDAATHDVSLPRRIPTNTPLQALVTLNDPVYQEAARGLAQRMLAVDKLPGQSKEEALQARLNYGAECVLSRNLTPGELTVLKAIYKDVNRMRLPSSAAASPDHKELDTLTSVAGLLLNLDAALTR